ncbi:hypothetical protein PM082_006374 [Marasmius tenuissimus]|nr:hypothetical protein PM082_006374 [Marasmius tenuissimus]
MRTSSHSHCRSIIEYAVRKVERYMKISGGIYLSSDLWKRAWVEEGGTSERYMHLKLTLHCNEYVSAFIAILFLTA